MDNDMRRRLIRHLEAACRAYQQRIDFGMNCGTSSTAEDMEAKAAVVDAGEARADCMQIIYQLKRHGTPVR
jgi:hypothetical protein